MIDGKIVMLRGENRASRACVCVCLHFEAKLDHANSGKRAESGSMLMHRENASFLLRGDFLPCNNYSWNTLST